MSLISINDTKILAFIESMKGQGFYVNGVVPAWKESLEGVRLNCPDFDGIPLQTSFQVYIIVVFYMDTVKCPNCWIYGNIRQNVVEICIKQRSWQR